MRKMLAVEPPYSKSAPFQIDLGNPLGIGSSTSTIHAVLHRMRVEVFDKVQIPVADFGRVMVERGKVPHQNRPPFSLPLSFGQTKERGTAAKAKKVK